jgi:hypothetical protein
VSDERNPYIAPRAESFKPSDVDESSQQEIPLRDLAAEFGRMSLWLTISLPTSIFAMLAFAGLGMAMLLSSIVPRLILDGAFALFVAFGLAVLTVQLMRVRRAITFLRGQPDLVTLDNVVARLRNVFVATTAICAALPVLGILYLLGEALDLPWKI